MFFYFLKYYLVSPGCVGINVNVSVRFRHDEFVTGIVNIGMGIEEEHVFDHHFTSSVGK
jgi:uncharacterized protein YijF (DUF1287 family)